MSDCGHPASADGLSSQATEPVPVSAVPASMPDAERIAILKTGGLGKWVLERRAGFYGRAMGSEFEPYSFGWCAKVDAWTYLNLNLAMCNIGAKVYGPFPLALRRQVMAEGL